MFLPQVAEQELDQKSKQLASADQAAKLSARLSSASLTTCDTRASEDTEAPALLVSALLNDILCDVVSQGNQIPEVPEVLEEAETGESGEKAAGCSVEIDCTGPDITVQPLDQAESPSRHRHRHRLRVVGGLGSIYSSNGHRWNI